MRVTLFSSDTNMFPSIHGGGDVSVETSRSPARRPARAEVPTFSDVVVAR